MTEKIVWICDLGVGGRTLWMATHVHEMEVGKLRDVHNKLKDVFPDMLTVLVPDTPTHCDAAICYLHSMGAKFAVWSPHEDKCPSPPMSIDATHASSTDEDVDVFIVDPRRTEYVFLLSHIAGVVFVGCSLLHGMKGFFYRSFQRK